MASVWTAHEKRRLLYALYEYGPTNIEALHEMVPTKTKTEIKLLCEEHQKIALKKPNEKSKAPVKLWLQLFKRLRGSQTQPHDIVPRVLKYIGLFENRPSSESMDLKQCYLALAYMSRGLDFEQLDEGNNYFMFECLTRMAKYLKYVESKGPRKYLKTLNSFRDLYKYKMNPKSKLENSHILNPLGIPHDLLQLSHLDFKTNQI